MSWFAGALPADLSGKSVLDIGCNGGFYSIQMKRRGAERVLAIDSDPDYLAQARFAAEIAGCEITFELLSVYDVGSLHERFDLVLFMGVLYHLRHPLLALDLIRENVAGDLMVFQSMQRGSGESEPVASDYEFWDSAPFRREDFQSSILSSGAMPAIRAIGGRRMRLFGSDAASRRLRDPVATGGGGLHLPRIRQTAGRRGSLSSEGMSS